MDDLLIGMCEPSVVRSLKIDIDEFIESKPRDAKGHARYTYEQAVGLQNLQHEFQQATILSLIDCENKVVSRHSRPGHYLKSAPLASIGFGDVAH